MLLSSTAEEMKGRRLADIATPELYRMLGRIPDDEMVDIEEPVAGFDTGPLMLVPRFSKDRSTVRFWLYPIAGRVPYGHVVH